MRVFPVNDDVDRTLNALLGEIKHLMNGDTSRLIAGLGASYRKSYGVLLVHLREMARKYHHDNELARRLWYREIRETMILATLMAVPAELSDEEINRWASGLITVELAEQLSLNVLGKRPGSDDLIMQWLNSHNHFMIYSAAMALGWQFRLMNRENTFSLKNCLTRFGELLDDGRFVRPVGHALKMGVRFSPENRDVIIFTMTEWKTDGNANKRLVADEVLFEMEWKEL